MLYWYNSTTKKIGVFRKYYLLAKNRERVVVECLAELFQYGSVHAARTNIIFKLYLNRKNYKLQNMLNQIAILIGM